MPIQPFCPLWQQSALFSRITGWIITKFQILEIPCCKLHRFVSLWESYKKVVFLKSFCHLSCIHSQNFWLILLSL